MYGVNEHLGQNEFAAKTNLMFRTRMIWRDIAIWIGAYLISTHLDSDHDIHQTIANKLNSLPLEHGNILRMFFGDGAVEGYTALLSRYIVLLQAVVDAEKDGDSGKMDQLVEEINQNTDQRVEFLSCINPFWQKNIVKSLIHNFTTMTMDGVTAFSSGDYKRNIQLFDRTLSYTTEMGDYLGEGLLNYFQYSLRDQRIPRECFLVL